MTAILTTSPLSAALVHGILELEPTERGVRPHRLPRWVRHQFPDPQLDVNEVQPAGGRIIVTTSATQIELVTHPRFFTYQGVERPRGVLDVYVDDVLVQREALRGGDNVETNLQTGQSEFIPGSDYVLSVDGLGRGRKRIEIWLPHNEPLELIELRSDAPVASDGRTRPIWIHHGSSISQGSNATDPSETWVSIVARRMGLDFTNLGFGGSSFVDQFIARTIRDLEADVISLSFGINVVNLDGMKRRVFVPAVHGFIDTIRDGHPETPIVLSSPLYCGIHEDTPGPGAFDPETFVTGRQRFIATGTPGDTANGRLTLQTVREALRDVVAHRTGDENLHYIEGTDLYGEMDAEALPLTDNLHPSPEAHRLIAERVVERMTGLEPATLTLAR